MTEILNIEKLLAFEIPATSDEYDPRDAILYALGVGTGLSEQIDETHFLFERGLQTLPTMALVLGTPGFWPMDPSCGLDWLKILHGEQRLKVFEPIDSFGMLRGETKVTDIADKGPGNPALIRAVKQLKSLSGLLVAEATEVWVARGAGGFNGERNLPGDRLPPVPARDPDFEVILPTSPAQSAIYRLSGDRNPLHIDPETARKAGFDRPILHGLSTMGLIARALIHACGGSIAQNLREIGMRFTAPVYPGETIRTYIWQDADRAHFRAEAAERNLCIVDHGLAKIRANLPAD
ncbi:MaoC/PaaZ C-terminal domain-containing protein [Parasphingorhabdus sp.]|uniref:MaoC/PaaZ C-terminal domain-containing protein n=1 Tax=Parasphingorhabdus sp. TaxID=2709688 RepID=UPI003BB00E61